ncbi:hypothetical protein MJD09_08480, partial [bacterium]|nr:hypothetical protein [bacterium]
MHADGDAEIGLTCVGCHGGNGLAASKERAHVRPRQPDVFSSSANPPNSFAAINRESPEFIRFMNPGDFRIADQTCGKCHDEILNRMLTSIMSHSAMIPQAGTYNNGIVNSKIALFGESYLADGTHASLTKPSTAPQKPNAPSDGLPVNSLVQKLLPFPQFGIVPATDAFRVLERGNNEIGARGPGTDFHVAGGGIVIN